MARFREIVIEGPRGWSRGFLEGFLHARGLGDAIFDGEAEGFACAPVGERLHELLHPSSSVMHVLAREDCVEDVHRAVREAATEDPHVAVRGEREITGARLAFRFTIYARDHAQRVRSLVDPPPPGTRPSPDTSFRERIDPEARGVEAFAPAHDYELHGEGAVEGDLEAVVALARRCREEELIRIESLELLPPRES